MSLSSKSREQMRLDQSSGVTYERIPLQTVYGGKTLFDLYQDYEHSLGVQEAKDVYAFKAKLKTALIRYTLPGWGFPMHQGKATAAQTAAGLEFMKQISLLQVDQALDAQEQVFRDLGHNPADPLCRINRSALNKLLEFGRAQPYWNPAVGSEQAETTPRMLVTKKRCKHWHRLKRGDISLTLAAELDALVFFWQFQRQSPLVENTRIRYRREILDILGWLHRVKNVPLSELSLHILIPPRAVHHQETATRVRAMTEDYLEWVRSNVSPKFSTQRFAVQVLIYIAEYIEYVTF